MAPQSQQPSAQEGARKLLELFFVTDADALTVVNMEDDDDRQGRFGHLYDPPSMLESLVQVATTEENVGMPQLPPPVAVHSLQYNCTPFLDLRNESSLKKWHQVPVQIRNATSETIRIRWVDAAYGIRPSHTWNLPPRSSLSAAAQRDPSSQDANSNDPTWHQHCSSGHFFLLSIVQNSDSSDSLRPQEEDLFSAYDNDYRIAANSKETILGAYRPLRPLPSGNFHALAIREDSTVHPEHYTADFTTDEDQHHQDQRQLFAVQFSITDSYDALCVAAASLDPHCNSSSGGGTTIKFLTTILSNLIQHPNDKKYQQLRLSNPKIHLHLLSSWGAVQFLTLCGFERRRAVVDEEMNTNEDASSIIEEDYLIIIASDESTVSVEQEDRASVLLLVEIQTLALQLLQILSTRSASGFVPDVAPPTPWEPSRPILGGGGGKNKRWAETQGRRFISADDRWARAERVNRNRRNGRGRRPDPGNAPSSRGNWGR
jgi:hypothetical protein